MPAQIRLENAAALRRQLRRLGQETGGEALKAAVDDAGAVLLAEVKARAPVETGELKEKLTWRSVRRGRALRRGVARGRIGWPRSIAYAGPVEVGHRVVRRGAVVGHAAPRPYLRPAFDSLRERLVREIGQALDRAIDRAAR